MNKIGWVGICIGGVLIWMVGCASKGTGSREPQDYLSFLKDRPGADLRGAEEKTAIAAFQDYLSHLSRETVLAQTQQVYASDVFFNDTLKTVHGSAALEEYFLGTAANTQSITVDFTDVVRSGNDYYFRWIMEVKFKKFAQGQSVRTIGMTHVRFNSAGQVILHQDYWDSTQGLFEYVPVLGAGLRFLKARL